MSTKGGIRDRRKQHSNSKTPKNKSKRQSAIKALRKGRKNKDTPWHPMFVRLSVVAAVVAFLAVAFQPQDGYINFISAIIESTASPISAGDAAPRSSVDIDTLIPGIDKSPATKRDENALNVFDDQHQSDLLWGTYRPHIYYGMRTRTTTDAFVLGMMWYEPGPNPYHIQLRHVAKNEDDIGIRWLVHNGRDFGYQVINDTRLGVELHTYIYKKQGKNGGDWAFRVRGVPYASRDKPLKLAVMFYYGIELLQHGNIRLDTSSAQNQRPITNTPILEGFMPSTRDFAVILPLEHKQKSGARTYFSGVHLREVWQIEKHLRLVVPRSSRRAQLENLVHGDSNVYVLQRFYKGEFSMDMTFLSNTKERFSSTSKMISAAKELAGKGLDAAIGKALLYKQQAIHKALNRTKDKAIRR